MLHHRCSWSGFDEEPVRCLSSCSDQLLGALLRIKEVIRRRVEDVEDRDRDQDRRGMTRRLEDILRESSGEDASSQRDAITDVFMMLEGLALKGPPLFPWRLQVL